MNLDKFKEKYYYIRNIYTLNSYILINKKENPIIIGYPFTTLTNDEQNILSKLNRFSLSDETDKGICFNFKHSPSIYDAYQIRTSFRNIITITYSNKRSLIYAINVLNDLIDEDDENYLIPFIFIDDVSSFKYRGIIEGYYGEPWTQNNRLDMINFMENNRLNTYMYAPKMDHYHRDKWYILYPEEEMDKFRELIHKMREKEIDFWYCISPGHAPVGEKGFIYTGDSDFIRLFNKLDQMINEGINHFGLLLDDIDYNLTGENLQVFKTPGRAHAHICNKVYNYLKTKVDNLKFVMCPTEYHEIGSSPYREDLKQLLDENIMVFWTGDNVCAEFIDDDAIVTTQEAFNKKIMLWENFPVTDFTYGVRQYIAPLTNRSVNLAKYSDGFIINPMIYYEISKIAMVTESHYAWNSDKYDEDKSFRLSLDQIDLSFNEKAIDYIKFNYPSVLSYGSLYYEKKMVDNNNYPAIINYYKQVLKSVEYIENLDKPITLELIPWLNHFKKEFEIIKKIINKSILHEELLSFYQDIKFSGSELLDYLIQKEHLLNEEEYNELIKKRRGNPWYRVVEHKRNN